MNWFAHVEKPAGRFLGNNPGFLDQFDVRACTAITNGRGEFSFDNRPANRTWSWRRVGEKGRTVEKSAAYADLRLAVNDAVQRGFSPAAGNWVVRGVPMTMRSIVGRRTLSA